MSSDNYIFIRKWHGQYVVTSESASDDEPCEVRSTDPRFQTLKEAWDYAGTMYSEYGVECDFPVEMTVTEVIVGGEEVWMREPAPAPRSRSPLAPGGDRAGWGG